MTCLCQKIAGEDIALSPVCIGSLWLFKDLSSEEIGGLAKDAKRQKLEKGAVLFRQGDPADEMFLLKAGRIRLDKVFEDGSQITLDIRKAGEFTGENMFSEDGVYPVTAVCMEESMTCGFTRKQFEAAVLAYPNIGLQIIKTLSQQIDQLSSRVGSLATPSIEDRLFRVLSNVAREHGKTVPEGRVIRFPLTHEDLSFLTGAHRVSITRAMKALKDTGKIILQGRKLILTEMSGG